MALTPKRPRDSSPKPGQQPRPLGGWWALLALVVGLASGGGAWADVGMDELVRQLHAPALVPESAVEIKQFELELGPARFVIERGVVAPAKLEGGRIVELVFVGRARFRFEPPDAVEAGQLELFTGERRLDVAVEEAVLALADVAGAERLLTVSNGLPPDAASVERAASVHAHWLAATERRTTGVVPGLLRALAGDVAYRGYFAVWCASPEVGTFLYRFEPEELEAITLASYEAPELNFRQYHETQRFLRAQQRRRRWLGVQLEDLGTWDVWNSMIWNAGDGDAAGLRGFEPRHYTLEVTVRRDRMMLDGRARLELEVLARGRRSVRLDLMRDMEVERITGADGNELFWIRDGEKVVILLPALVEPGKTLVLDVAFQGRALQWVAGGNQVLTDTAAWYPHAGTLDRATYDVTLRWPRKHDLVAAGRLVAEGREDEYRWQRRRVELPAIAYSFVLGDYEIERGRLGDVGLTVAFDRGNRPSPSRRTEILRSVATSLEFFEGAFGPYPLDELTVATVPRGYSQSYLGFVTLSSSLVRDDARPWVRDATIAHEVAHQWWGNLIGWRSYRDQWLSEGMANYAALLYDVHSHGEQSNLLAVMSGGWRESLTQRTLEGRTVESLGPVTLGSRLNSSLAAHAYRPIVYRKGAVVLAMLARAVGEERFMGMLRGLADSYANRVLTTESFLGAVEEISDLDLEGFARQYVYGTGIPQVYYSYGATSDASGEWTLRGAARRLSQPSHRYRIARKPDGRLDLECESVAEASGQEATELLVPFEVELESAEPTAGSITGRLTLIGVEETFEIRTPRRPRELRLDPRGEILANFYSQQGEPKLYLRHRAEDLALQGQAAAAETLYLEALRTSSPVRGVGAFEATMRERRERTEDLRISLALVRLWIDQERDAEALRWLDNAEANLAQDQREQFGVERDVLRSRLEIRGGDHASARRRLKKTLRLADPRPGDDWRDLMWQARLRAERRVLTEAYALLAIATHETGRMTEYARAAAAARTWGVDLRALEDEQSALLH